MNLTEDLQRVPRGGRGLGAQATNLPSWAAALSPGQWFEITSSAPNAVVLNHSVIDSWNGMALDTRDSKCYLCANGGHQDYDGNEVYKLTLETETPTWAVEKTSTYNGTESCVATYASGDPCSRHSYYGVHMNELENKVMLVGGAWFCSLGTPILPTTDSYNIISKTYSAAGTHPDQPVDLRHADCTYCLDPTRGDIYGKYATGLFGRWNRATNTWTADLGDTGSPPDAEGAAMSAWDTSRDRMVVFGGDHSASAYYDRATNKWTSITLTGARASDILAAQAASMQYVVALDSFIVRRSPAGNDIIKINAASYFTETFPNLSGGTAIQSNNPYTSPIGSGAGPYSKFRYVPRLKGAIFVQGFDLNCYFLRVH